MTKILMIAAATGLALFLIIGARRIKKQTNSKLAIFEHPSSFTKPKIEMVSGANQRHDQDEKKMEDHE